MVVPVFITSCQVLEKLNNGPVHAQMMTMKKAMKLACALPAAWVTKAEKRVYVRAHFSWSFLLVVFIINKLKN